MSLESNELQNELEMTIRLLEAEIPANPAAPKNESIEKGLERSLRKYFKHLDDAMSIEGLERIYNRNV